MTPTISKGDALSRILSNSGTILPAKSAVAIAMLNRTLFIRLSSGLAASRVIGLRARQPASHAIALSF
jgi:hypothetical protein